MKSYGLLCSYVLVFVVLSVNSVPIKDFKSYFRKSKEGSFRKTGECDCVCGVSNRQMRVVGGNITKIHEFPWIAGISKGGDFHCGASVITKRHVITAAHCVEGFHAKDLTIVLADHDRESTNRFSEVEVRGVKNIRQHEFFDSRTFNNDIAVLELDKPVQFGPYIQPACLPQSSDFADYIGRLGVIAGWGRTGENEKQSKILRKIVVPVWTKDECHNTGYEIKRISENMFCAGYPEGKTDSCQGDSGGPLVMHKENGNMEIIGLVSWGRGCGRPNLPGIYTKVSNYLGWLNESLQGECLCTSAHLNPRRA